MPIEGTVLVSAPCNLGFSHLPICLCHACLIVYVKGWLAVCLSVCLSHCLNGALTCGGLLQKLAENDEDDYTNSAWANPKALKHHFSGVGGVRIR